MKVDIVVKPPQRPVAQNRRAEGDRISVSAASAATTPNVRQPSRLAQSVPCGNVIENRCPTKLSP